jgi:hypothetical protein
LDFFCDGLSGLTLDPKQIRLLYSSMISAEMRELNGIAPIV